MPQRGEAAVGDMTQGAFVHQSRHAGKWGVVFGSGIDRSQAWSLVVALFGAGVVGDDDMMLVDEGHAGLPALAGCQADFGVRVPLMSDMRATVRGYQLLLSVVKCDRKCQWFQYLPSEVETLTSLGLSWRSWSLEVHTTAVAAP